MGALKAGFGERDSGFGKKRSCDGLRAESRIQNPESFEAMMLITCPHADRARDRVHLGGDANVRRPANPDSLTNEQWAEYVYMRDNPRGEHSELWQHSFGCRAGLPCRRNTYTTTSADGTSRMSQPFRLATADSSIANRPLEFTFNGRRLTGYAGDSLAPPCSAMTCGSSAAVSNIIRPRGIVCAGRGRAQRGWSSSKPAREPSESARNAIELYDGLVAASQNCWPSVAFDVSRREQPGLACFYPLASITSLHVAAVAVADLRKVDPARLPAWAVRRAHLILPSTHHHAHCDVLVAGGGPAGLAAALAAARAGAARHHRRRKAANSVAPALERADIDGEPALNWVKHTLAALRAAARVDRAQPQHSVRPISTINGSPFPERPAQLRPTHLPNDCGKCAPHKSCCHRRTRAPARVSRQRPPRRMLASAARTYANRIGEAGFAPYI